MSKTPIASHQNVAQHVSSKKQLSTKTADRHAHARSYHHAWSLLKCTCQSRPTECSHMGKANLSQNTATAKQCQVVSITFIATEWFFQIQKFWRFLNISGRFGEVQPLKILLAVCSFNLSGPPKTWTISGPYHLYRAGLLLMLPWARI